MDQYVQCGVVDGSATMHCYCGGHDTDFESMCLICFEAEDQIYTQCGEAER